MRYSINYIIPNLITATGFCTGLTTIWFAMQDNWQAAVIATYIASLLDIMDGLSAKLLKGTSSFGVQLDSLSDLTCFGIAPALLIYLWSTHQSLPWGWLATLFFCLGGLLRLARFNLIAVDKNRPDWRRGFFVGVPIPAAAGMLYIPLLMSFSSPTDNWLREPTLNMTILIILGILMLVPLPTFTLKRMPQSRLYRALIGLLLLSLFVFILFQPWLGLLLMASCYLLSLPIAVVVFFHLRRKDAA